jgi:hypothetical protein
MGERTGAGSYRRQGQPLVAEISVAFYPDRVIVIGTSRSGSVNVDLLTSHSTTTGANGR